MVKSRPCLPAICHAQRVAQSLCFARPRWPLLCQLEEQWRHSSKHSRPVGRPQGQHPCQPWTAQQKGCLESWDYLMRYLEMSWDVLRCLVIWPLEIWGNAALKPWHAEGNVCENNWVAILALKWLVQCLVMSRHVSSCLVMSRHVSSQPDLHARKTCRTASSTTSFLAWCHGHGPSRSDIGPWCPVKISKPFSNSTKAEINVLLK